MKSKETTKIKLPNRFKSNVMTMAIAYGIAFAGASHAIAITGSTDANALATAIGGGRGLSIISSTLSGHTSGGATSSGTYTNTSGTYGIGDGIIISSGDVNDYNDGPNIADDNTTSYNVSATAAQQDLLFPISGQAEHFDVTQFNVEFTTNTGEVFFLVTFGSDEFDEFKNSTFIDAFGLYLNGVNIAFYNGFPVNIDHPDMDFCGGTELDGVLTCGGPMLFSAAGLDTTQTHNLTFIIADSDDSSLDSTAYISSLSGANPVPEPGSLALMGLGLVGLAAIRRRKESLKQQKRQSGALDGYTTMP